MKLKLYMVCALAALQCTQMYTVNKAYVLSSKTLKSIDSIGAFNAEIFKIWQTYILSIKLVTGKKLWSGAIVHLQHQNTTIPVHVKNPELLFGANFLVLSPEHSNLNDFVTAKYQEQVEAYKKERLSLSLQDRQKHTSMDSVFTGSYVQHPITNEEIPVYVSEYAMCSYDFRHGNARLGVPAHDILDFTFAQQHDLPINLAYNIPADLAQKYNADMPEMKQNIVTAPYTKTYRQCVMQKGTFLEDMSLQEAQKAMIAYLEEHNLGTECEELIQYTYDSELHSIRSLARIEKYLEDNKETLGALYDKKMAELQNILAYAHEDFFEIVQPFFSNITTSSQPLIQELVAESVKLHNHENSILLQWAQGSELNFRKLIQQDLTSFTILTKLCKELVDFIADFKESCPQAAQVLRSAQEAVINQKN